MCMLILSACHFKSICPECEVETVVMIKFDWSKVDVKPEGMTVLFYNEQDELVYSFLNVSPEGRLVNLSSGHYYAVCYNNDTESVQWRNQDNINTLEAYTTETELRAEHSRASSSNKSGEVLIEMPNELYGQCRWDVVVRADDSENQIIWFVPEQLTDTYVYKFINVSNSKYITSIRATLGGLNDGYFIAHPQKASKVCTMPFDANVEEANKSVITGNMINFGYNKGQVNKLTLYIWSQGGNIRGTWDVTKQVIDAPNPHYVVIIIDSPIIVPLPIGNDGDVVNPSVDDWIDINEDIIL